MKKVFFGFSFPRTFRDLFWQGLRNIMDRKRRAHNKIYQTDLQGNILQQFSPKGDDFEGITYDHYRDVLWIAEEQLQEIVKISIDGLELERIRLTLQKSGPNGLEGVTLDQLSGFWVVNEKKPVSLARLDSAGNEIHVYKDALAKDYSDVFYDIKENVLWIISDESKLLIKWSREHGLIEQFKLPFDKAEGITVQPQTQHIYIVNDALSTLSLFDLIEN